MTVLRSLADLVGRLAQLLAPESSEPQWSLTEDDIRTDQYRRAHQVRG